MQQELNNKIHIFLISAIAFCLPIHPDLIPPLIVLASINWILNPAKISHGLSQLTKNKSVLALPILFILYSISILYSTNVNEGMKILESKLSFIALPIIFSTQIDSLKENRNKYLRYFLYGCIATALLCILWAAVSYIKPIYTIIDGQEYDLGLGNFYYSHLSIFHHPTYLSMYVNFSLLIFLYLLIIGNIKFNWKWLLVSFLLTTFIFLLSSKAGWSCLFLNALFVIFYLLKNKHIFTIILLTIIIGSQFYIINISAPAGSERIVSTKEVIVKADSNEDLKKTNDGTASRILVWKAALEIIKEHPLIGAGVGNTKTVMLKKYKEKGMIHEYEKRLNAHNQYLNTFVALGIIGFLCLQCCLLLPFIYAIKNKHILIGTFVFLIAYNFLFESMLETQAGVMFYAFFNSLLCFNKK